MSYDHCRKCFLVNKINKRKYNLITLHLYAYLASWGMLRNSFLMQKDYLFNKPIVKILCENKYSTLIDWSPYNKTEQEIDEYINLVLELKTRIKEYYLSDYYYNDKCEKIKIKNVTDTLVSKILLGTLGCIPAYDQYLVKALRHDKIVGTLSKKSISKVVEFAMDNEIDISKLCKKLGPLYPPMKIIDMYFWEKGITK